MGDLNSYNASTNYLKQDIIQIQDRNNIGLKYFLTFLYQTGKTLQVIMKNI